MKEINGKTVSRVCAEMDRFSETQMSEEAARFIRQEPHLAEFLKEFTAEFSSDVQQMALYLSYLIWKICTNGWGRKMPRLTWAMCYHCFLKERRSLQFISKKSQNQTRQTALLQWLKSLIEKDYADLFNKETEKGSLLVLLRTVVSAFENAIHGL